jgi:hypothetical protein
MRHGGVAPRAFGHRETLVSFDGGTYARVHEAKGQVFGEQDRHVYTSDRFEATTSGLTQSFTDSKFVLRTDAPDASWATVYRCVDWRRDMHTFWLSTSPACDNSGDDPGQRNGAIGFISTVNRPNMAPLFHLRRGTHNATGVGTGTPEHDTHDHVFAGRLRREQRAPRAGLRAS